MIVKMLNFETGLYDNVEILELTDRDAFKYLPINSASEQQKAVMKSLYSIYRYNGKSQFDAIVEILINIVTGKQSE